MVYRFVEYESFGFIFNYLIFGWEVVLLVELVVGLFVYQKRLIEEYINELEDILVVVYEIVRNNLLDVLKW